MASARDLYYSPICDKDPRAYLAYIYACSGHGSSNGKFAAVNGGSGESRCNGSGNNVSGGAFGTNGNVRQVQDANVIADLVACGDFGGVVDIVNTGTQAGLSSWYTAAGFSIDNFDCRGNSVDGVRGVQSRWSDWNVNNSHVSDESVALARSDDCVTDGVKPVSRDSIPEVCEIVVKEEEVSARTILNRKSREKKKKRKARRRLNALGDIPEWRRNAVAVKSEEIGEVKVPAYRGAFGSCSEEIRSKLADTRARRLIAENEASIRRAESDVSGWDTVQKCKRKQNAVRLLKTEQEYELIRSRDVEQLKRRQETRIMRDTETNKVAVERAFGTLAATGNAVGTVQTIVGSGSISPNSSVSAAEVRKMHKEMLDLKKQNADLVERLRGCNVGANNDVPYSVGITVDEEGHPIGDFGDGYGGYIGTDGRFHTGINWAEYY